MKQTNISVFIPHYGCTHICSFCNQKTISGHSEPVTEKELESILEGQLENLKDSGTKAQIAFFGGSFTAIDRDYMIRLLTVAKRYTDAYPEQYDGIRCSTRPDCIDEEILGILKSYGMTAIELGAQSMNDEVLTANRRGHTAQDVRRASRLIKQSGFELGLQMMTGLYKDTEQYCIDTAKEFIALHCDTVRIYPTVILKIPSLADCTRAERMTALPLSRQQGSVQNCSICLTRQGSQLSVWGFTQAVMLSRKWSGEYITRHCVR